MNGILSHPKLEISVELKRPHGVVAGSRIDGLLWIESKDGKHLGLGSIGMELLGVEGKPARFVLNVVHLKGGAEGRRRRARAMSFKGSGGQLTKASPGSWCYRTRIKVDNRPEYLSASRASLSGEGTRTFLAAAPPPFS
jgi:hypothetical protein